MSVIELFPIFDSRSVVQIAERQEHGLRSYVVTVETPHGRSELFHRTIFRDKALDMARQAAFRFGLKRIVDSTEAAA